MEIKSHSRLFLVSILQTRFRCCRFLFTEFLAHPSNNSNIFFGSQRPETGTSEKSGGSNCDSLDVLITSEPQI